MAPEANTRSDTPPPVSIKDTQVMDRIPLPPPPRKRAVGARGGQPGRRRTSHRVWQPLAESLALLALLGAANLLLFPGNPAFVKWAPHPILFVTMLILVRYGFSAGLQAAAASALGYGLLLVTRVDVPTPLHFLSAPYSNPVVQLVPMTVLFGMLVQRHLDRRDAAETASDRFEVENRRLLREQAELREVNVELAAKVVGAGTTMQTLYRHAKELNVNDPAQILGAIAGIVKDVLEVETVAVWQFGPTGELKLVGFEGVAPAPGWFLDPRLEEYFDSHGILALHDVPETLQGVDTPYLAGRICDGLGGRREALATVERLPFGRYTPETVRLFGMVVDWASESLGRALAFERLSPERRSAELELQRRNSAEKLQAAQAKAQAQGQAPGPLPVEDDENFLQFVAKTTEFLSRRSPHSPRSTVRLETRPSIPLPAAAASSAASVDGLPAGAPPGGPPSSSTASGVPGPLERSAPRASSLRSLVREASGLLGDEDTAHKGSVPPSAPRRTGPAKTQTRTERKKKP